MSNLSWVLKHEKNKSPFANEALLNIASDMVEEMAVESQPSPEEAMVEVLMGEETKRALAREVVRHRNEREGMAALVSELIEAEVEDAPEELAGYLEQVRAAVCALLTDPLDVEPPPKMAGPSGGPPMTDELKAWEKEPPPKSGLKVKGPLLEGYATGGWIKMDQTGKITGSSISVKNDPF